MDPNLEGFIGFLEDQGLVELDIVGNGDRQFVNRLKLQKYVFLAKNLGMSFHYQYTMYLYGPYSKDLAADYYALARRSGLDGRCSAVPAGFRKDVFLTSIRNDPKWLEIAATIVDKNESIKGRTDLLNKVCLTKCGFPEEFINGVLNDLEARGLVSVGA